ncbi:MAG: SAM-dependent methyltransferase, partial [Pirellulaceae bacterium]|nr:SAM-dependent methyltransferase [Pirellulaceae bacterium]
MSAQDRTLDQYHEYMQINSVSHFLRAAREVGLLGELSQGQRTAEQLIETLKLAAKPAVLMLDALMAIGIVEKYEDDYALSRAAHLLCQYDNDLGDARWQKLADSVQG